jgi:hypothetical protein
MTNKKGDEQTNNGRQNTTQKTNDWETLTLLKRDVDSGAPEGYAIPAPTVTVVWLSYYCQTTRISSEMKIVLEISTNYQNTENYVIQNWNYIQVTVNTEYVEDWLFEWLLFIIKIWKPNEIKIVENK